MNVYLACPITGGRGFEPVNQAHAHAMLEMGHDVATAYLAESDAVAVEAAIPPNKV